jgi:uncharacterized protein with HEPN domain
VTAASLLRNARLAAGMTQEQLARAGGVTQSVISAYESGRREPALSTLARLIEATGGRLETTVGFDGAAKSRTLRDILEACDAIEHHLGRGPAENPLGDGLVFDAVRVRLMEIGEAVKDLDQGLLAAEPGLPWRQIAGMRDWLMHRYFDTSHSVVAATVRNDVPELRAVAGRLLAISDAPRPD